MTVNFTITASQIDRLDLTAVKTMIADELMAEMPNPPLIHFEIDYPLEPEDPRELSEIPEIRLWFVRLDVAYPWLIYHLDWSTEIARYTAMLVPHQFSRTEGIQYNPEALELFIMGKVFAVDAWLKQHQIAAQGKIQSMLQMLGYDLDEAFLNQLLD
ncbi:MAG: CRR6 family NdhI maturation factor [Spirulina sp. SIO3F2]|nr:CRR6 family NdhI maturation factor [Spirulina sp. SIO3F2]